MEHTPGPWKVVWEYCDCGGDYQCSHGRYPYELIAPNKQVERYPNAKPDETYPAIIANFSEANNVTIGDIQLIVAAPDLLEACEAMVEIALGLSSDLTMSWTTIGKLNQVIEDTEAAIAKARGS